MLRGLFLVLLVSLSVAEIRVYRQVSDVAAKQNGRIEKSSRNDNLFEFTYDVDLARNIVTRTKIRRLDQESAVADATRYKIMSERNVISSKAGTGGPAIIAVEENGSEIIQLGDDFAFTSRTSDFSQMITGVYKRI
jgi:hypothetical protein